MTDKKTMSKSLEESIEAVKEMDAKLQSFAGSSNLMEMVQHINKFYDLHPDCKDILTIIESHNKAQQALQHLVKIIEERDKALGKMIWRSEDPEQAYKAHPIDIKEAQQALSITLKTRMIDDE